MRRYRGLKNSRPQSAQRYPFAMINDVILPTGTQYEISHGPWQAIVTEQGASLRSLRHDGVDVVKLSLIHI